MKSISSFIKDYKHIILLFIFWRLLLFVPQLLIMPHIPLQQHYLGGGLQNYQSSILWSWANFDGEHYLSIVQFGYKPLTYFFFPMYPLIIRFISDVVGITIYSSLLAGIVLSHMTFFLSLIGLWKLISLDYEKPIALHALLTLSFFPSAFYFAGVYTESLFLCLAVWSFYFSRTKKWFFSGMIGGLSSATRLVGIMLLPALFVEYTLQHKRKLISPSIIFLAIVPLGLVLYMLFLIQKTADPLAFTHSIEIFGEQRSSHIILLPQVFYRYVFKILPNMPLSYFFGVFTTYSEFIVGLLFLIISLFAFFKLRLSYAIFLFGAYLLPTFSGSFSSLPRYVLTAFPAFIVIALLISRAPRGVQIVYYLISTILLFIGQSLFMRGYWYS